jgi:hypothetical protein
MNFTRLSASCVAVLALGGCGGSETPGANATTPTDIGACPFDQTAAGGALLSPAVEIVLDGCTQDRALCSIRVDAPCSVGGPVITEWECDCAGGRWVCEVSGRNPAACPNAGAT